MNLFKCTVSLFLIIILTGKLNAQFSDDFSTPSLQQWRGDTADFKVTMAEELQLNASMAGTSWLYTNVQIPDSAVWELYVRLEFNPSGNNNFQWVLQSTNSTKNELNGYGIQLGESGSDDALEFVRWDNGIANVLGRMESGSAGTDPVTLSIKVERLNGNFHVLASYDGTEVYTDSLEVADDNYSSGPLLTTGLICNYTSTRADLFHFDDYVISRKTPDTQAPEIVDFSVSEDQLTIDFNELIHIDNANFDISPGSFQLDPMLTNSGASLQLEVDPDFISLTDYTLSISNLEDKSENVAAQIDIPFQYIATRTATPFDIVINEIMAAPNETTSLPDIEYVEIYNRTNDHLQLENLFITDETSAVSLPAYTFAPGSYLILCDTEDTSALSIYGNVLGIPSFVGLNNSSDFVQLRDVNSVFIHGVNYTDNWYKDNQKDDGGFSLELIHPDLTCSQEAAFKASESPLGGTPGQENSVFNANFKDLFRLDQLGFMNNEQIILRFNQWLAPSSEPKDHISIDPIVEIDQADLRVDQPNTLDLILNNPLEQGNIYDIEITSSFENCLREPIDTTLSAQIGIPAEPTKNDLIISEIMFDPNSGESQWVEIYNASEQVFEFRYLVLKVIDEEGVDQTTIGLEHQILPGQYFVLSENSIQVAETYNASYPNQILEIDLPSFNRDGGGLQLWYIFGAEAHSLDSVCYQEDWHSGFLRDEKGVSLERLQLETPACSPNNWQSAAATALYGTPTGPNSQRLDSPDKLDNEFTLLSPTFSPDGDGFEDIAVIHYSKQDESQPPPQLNLNIYTPDGRLVNPLYSNYSLSNESQLIWDGRMTNGMLAPEGFYLIHATTFNEEGDISKWKATLYLVYPE